MLEVTHSKGYMNYAGGHCTECGRAYVKRSWEPILLTVEKCFCEEGSVIYIKIWWEQYLQYMEDGAIYVESV